MINIYVYKICINLRIVYIKNSKKIVNRQYKNYKKIVNFL